MNEPAAPTSRTPTDAPSASVPIARWGDGAAQPFPGLSHDAPGHFRLHFYAAVDRVLQYLDTVAGQAEGLQPWLERFPFLGGYLAELEWARGRTGSWDENNEWWRERIIAWEGEVQAHLPLRALGDVGVSWRDRLALVIVGLAEEDSRFGTLFTQLQNPLPARRPCLELVGRLLACRDGGVDPWSVCRPLVERGLAGPLDERVPRAEWLLRVPDVIWDAIRGERSPLADRGFDHIPRTDLPESDELVFRSSFVRRVEQVPALLREGKADAVVVRGSPGSDRRAVAGAVARSLGRGLLVAKGEAAASRAAILGPLSVLTDAMPVLQYDLGPGETGDVPALPGHAGPIACVLGSEGGLRGAAVDRAVTLQVPPLGRAERLRHWRLAFGDQPVEDLSAITDRFHLPGAHIRQAAAKAVAQARLDGRHGVRSEDVRQACRLLNRQLLDTLAEHLHVDGLGPSRPTDNGGWEPLVVGEAARAKLSELQQRCRHRESVLDHLGPAFGSNTNRGVRALFTGPSGTGKTLAAKLVAARLGMDLYRVDLASVVNKYIGETEKNLHRVLSTAEELDVVLLLDEGDSLLGSRTEVKSSNDRYANLETNYLLQRLEHYQGIVLVTTNLGENIDRAFQRRMDLVVDFLPPRADERLMIWSVHLPDSHSVPGSFLDEVARRCDLTGGQIRNAAQLATLLAMEDGGVVRAVHVDRAVRSEYRKAGATCPLQDGPPSSGHGGSLQAFLEAFGG